MTHHIVQGKWLLEVDRSGFVALAVFVTHHEWQICEEARYLIRTPVLANATDLSSIRGLEHVTFPVLDAEVIGFFFVRTERLVLAV